MVPSPVVVVVPAIAEFMSSAERGRRLAMVLYEEYSRPRNTSEKNRHIHLHQGGIYLSAMSS